MVQVTNANQTSGQVEQSTSVGVGYGWRKDLEGGPVAASPSAPTQLAAQPPMSPSTLADIDQNVCVHTISADPRIRRSSILPRKSAY